MIIRLKALALAIMLLGLGAAGTLAQDAQAPVDQTPVDNDGAVAQQAADPSTRLVVPTIDEATQQRYTAWTTQLDSLRVELDRERISLDGLAGLRDQAAKIRDDVQASIDTLGPRLAEQRALLDGLMTSTNDTADTPEVAALRQQVADLEAQLQTPQLLLARATALRDEAIARRAAEFANRLLAHSSPLVSPALWVDGLGGMPALFTSARNLTMSSWRAVSSRATTGALVGLGVLFAVLLLLAIPLRRLALKRAARRAEIEPQTLERLLAALRIIVLSAGIPVLGFAMLLVGLDSVGGLSLRARSIVEAIAVNISLFFLISGLGQAFLAPGLRAWRLVPLADGYAGRAAWFIRLAALAYVSGELFRTLASIFISPLPVVQLSEAVPVFLAALAILGAMRAVMRGIVPPQETEGPQPISHILWRWTVPIAGLSAIAALVAQVLGFLALGSFLIDRLVWTAVVLAGLHLFASLAERMSAALFQDNARAASWVHDNIGLTPASLGQFGVLLSGLVKLVLILTAALFIIAPFGVETVAFGDVLREVFTGIQIGGFSFSLTSVLISLALVFTGVVVTRAIQGWLENRYLPRTSLDAGLKASIRTGFGYVGIIIAAAVGLSYLGLNLENIALVAGALSVGIGFGLQSIVSNFVSGLILLAERPFKAGDWIVVGQEQGIVKRINVRATEIQTFDRATVLIPNSDFIAGTVKNRVHRDTLGRIDIPVGVGYDSDPEEVRRILLEVASAHPQTLSYPEPAAFFVEFGANSLDFMLFAYLADVGNGYSVRSDIRFEIFKRFKQAGIEIPFAQSDVTIRNIDEVIAALVKAGSGVPERLGSGSSGDAVSRTGVQTVPSPVPTSDPSGASSGRQG